MKSSSLLLMDAIINLLLGVLLMVFPTNLVAFLGIPAAQNAFYPSILGAVLFGIGIALLLERYRHLSHTIGLGLGGAISINLIGGVVLAVWLVTGNLSMSLRGYVLLWLLVLILLGISACELLIQLRVTRADTDAA